MSGPADLTPSQWKAVDHLEGPLLVVAGPGSGKTRVITRRIARMVERGVNPRDILAITFTNKAAREMAARVDALLPGSNVWVSTFHRFCASMLRRRAEGVGLKSNYTIYDTTDQHQLLRRVMHDLDIDPVHYPPGRIGGMISNAKNDMRSATDFVRRFEETVGNHFEAVVARVYPAYQERLLESNAVDFDDLLLQVVTLLDENPELRADLDERFKYVLVDEYQDTNMAQYRIVAALSQDQPNLCVTGDPDQSIYGWRGAQIENILRFERDYPDATVVKLEENFRSTKSILRAADSLIVHNRHRKAKFLRTDNDEGRPVELLTFLDGRHEADSIAAEIRRRVEAGERQLADFAVVYRVNALSREIELALSRHRMAYQVAAGVAFYDRAEIKDLIAYLRLIHNPDDQTAFLRVINTPPRGIGKTTQTKLLRWATASKITVMEAAAAVDQHPDLNKRAKTAVRAFAELIEELTQHGAGSVGELMKRVIDRTHYTTGWIGSEQEQDQQRLANIDELVTAAFQYDHSYGEEASLEGFLESVSLTSDVDGLSDGGQVTLMTLHAAKGLEFPVVYIVGVEQNLIPHERSLREGNPREYEEERRLLFVGMTRAREELYLTETRMRDVRGRPMHTIPSDFLSEIAVERNDFTDGKMPITEMGYDEHSQVGYDPEAEEQVLRQRRARNVASTGDLPKLMTGADLLNGTSGTTGIPQGFAVGSTVRHPQYGLGTVIKSTGFGEKRMVTVHFHEGDFDQAFRQAKAPLQPVGMQ